MPHSRFSVNDWRPYPPLPQFVRDNSICRNAPLDWFYPPKGLPALGKRLCAECPAQPVCLQFAMDNHINFGVWGGLSERERYVERRNQKSASK